MCTDRPTDRPTEPRSPRRWKGSPRTRPTFPFSLKTPFHASMVCLNKPVLSVCMRYSSPDVNHSSAILWSGRGQNRTCVFVTPFSAQEKLNRSIWSINPSRFACTEYSIWNLFLYRVIILGVKWVETNWLPSVTFLFSFYLCVYIYTYIHVYIHTCVFSYSFIQSNFCDDTGQ